MIKSKYKPFKRDQLTADWQKHYVEGFVTFDNEWKPIHWLRPKSKKREKANVDHI